MQINSSLCRWLGDVKACCCPCPSAGSWALVEPCPEELPLFWHRVSLALWCYSTWALGFLSELLSRFSPALLCRFLTAGFDITVGMAVTPLC